MNIMTLEERKELGNRLKQARKEKGLSQEELANLIGLKVGTVSKYEQGDRTPGIGKLQLIANALECDTSRFVASGDEYVRMTQTTDFGNNLDAYLNWLKFPTSDAIPVRLKTMTEVNLLPTLSALIRKLFQSVRKHWEGLWNIKKNSSNNSSDSLARTFDSKGKQYAGL